MRLATNYCIQNQLKYARFAHYSIKNVPYLSESRHYGTDLTIPNWFIPQRCGAVRIGEYPGYTSPTIPPLPPLYYLPYPLLPYTTPPCSGPPRIELFRKSGAFRIEMSG